MEEKPVENKRMSFPGMVLSILIAIGIALGGRWYYYVAYADSPFDEVGIQLNYFMPGPINRIGCDMLEQRFGTKTIPPMGCGTDGNW